MAKRRGIGRVLFATAELRRSRSRFGLLTVGGGLLVFVLLFQQALLAALLDGMAGAIDHQSAPVLVLAREAQQSVSGSAVTSDQVGVVAAAPGVEDAAELGITFLSFRRSGNEEWHNASVLGFRPGRAGTPTGLRSGRLPATPTEVVASAEDAPGRYGLGETIVVEPGGVPLVVVGLTEGGRMGISPTVWVPWETYERLVLHAVPEAPEVLASVVAVQPEAGIGSAELVRDLDSLAPELEAMTREEAAAAVPGRDAVRLGFLLVMGLSYLVVAAAIAFFFLMLTLQKQAATTMLRAVGARSGYLVRCLLWQVALVTAGALALGASLLLLAVHLLRSTIVLTADPAGMASVAVPAASVALVAALPALIRVARTDAAEIFDRSSAGRLG